MGRVDLLGFGQDWCIRGATEGGDEALELGRRADLEHPGRLGSDLEGVRATTRQPHDRAVGVDALGISARKPDVALDHVEEFVLDVVAVQRWTEVPGGEELHDRHLTIGVFAGQLGREEVVEEVEVLAFVAGDDRRGLKGHVGDGTNAFSSRPSPVRADPIRALWGSHPHSWGMAFVEPTPYRRRPMGIASFTAARDRLLAAEATVTTGEDACAAIASAILEVAPHQAAAVMTTDPDTHLPAGGVVRGFDPKACVPFWDNELLDPDFNKFNDLARSVEPVATLAESTDGDLARSPRYQKLYASSGAVDELRVAIVAGTTCLAIGAFVRCDGPPFSATEVRDVRNLLVPAAGVLRVALGHMAEPISPSGPVVVLLGADGSVVSRSEGADDVLDDLRLDVDGDLPGTVHVAAQRARSQRSSTRLTTRLRGRSGRWVRMHVSPMEGDDIVSVTIDAAPPGDLVPILLDSYGLTERETEIVLHLCRGIGTKEIAAEMAISVHTVRDHLKAIFDKSEVSSRGELVARLFADHALQPFHESVTAV